MHLAKARVAVGVLNGAEDGVKDSLGSSQQPYHQGCHRASVAGEVVGDKAVHLQDTLCDCDIVLLTIITIDPLHRTMLRVDNGDFCATSLRFTFLCISRCPHVQF